MYSTKSDYVCEDSFKTVLFYQLGFFINFLLQLKLKTLKINLILDNFSVPLVHFLFDFPSSI